ncbi:MAG: hypothetical protein IJO77_03585, partial [Oscillospiraceae bacterium]|nr:hypothetical protein [Oscillospiraceae bacterium]
CNGEADRIALAFGTVVLAALPFLLEKLFHCRISLPLYIFALAYAIGPMLGHCWKLYYTLPGWDKLLHTTGGVMFVILGAYLFELLMRGQNHQTAKVIFSLCFSMAVAVLWEFCEFGADTFLGMDMQYDTVVHGLNSYLLGDRVGVIGSISDIESITVNSVLLPTDGYIDIGLIDTMLDMLLETIGAVIACIIMWLDKGKHPFIKKV